MHGISGRRRFMRRALALASLPAWPLSGQACEFQTSHLTIVHPWTRATPEGASEAQVCMNFKDVLRTDRLVGLDTPVARSARMTPTPASGEVDFEIPAGSEVALGEGAVTLHLTGLRQPLLMAREYPLVLRFAEAGPVVATLTVAFERFR